MVASRAPDCRALRAVESLTVIRDGGLISFEAANKNGRAKYRPAVFRSVVQISSDELARRGLAASSRGRSIPKTEVQSGLKPEVTSEPASNRRMSANRPLAAWWWLSWWCHRSNHPSSYRPCRSRNRPSMSWWWSCRRFTLQPADFLLQLLDLAAFAAQLLFGAAFVAACRFSAAIIGARPRPLRLVRTSGLGTPSAVIASTAAMGERAARKRNEAGGDNRNERAVAHELVLDAHK
jgi:hypothetical protein